jgi:cyclopropane fatty-acyl-phospholipid synthase-like methyltransferase
MVDAYLVDLDLSPGARVLEVGCGTGAISRMLAQHPF